MSFLIISPPLARIIDSQRLTNLDNSASGRSALAMIIVSYSRIRSAPFGSNKSCSDFNAARRGTNLIGVAGKAKLCKFLLVQVFVFLINSNAYALSPDPLVPEKQFQMGFWTTSYSLDLPCQCDVFHLPLIGAVFHPQLLCRLNSKKNLPVFGAAGLRLPMDKKIGLYPALSLAVLLKIQLKSRWVLSPFARWIVGKGYKNFGAEFHPKEKEMSRAAFLEWWDLYHGLWGVKSSYETDYGTLTFGFQESLPILLRSLQPLLHTQNARVALVFIEMESVLYKQVEFSAGLSFISLELGSLRVLFPAPLFGLRFWI